MFVGVGVFSRGLKKQRKSIGRVLARKETVRKQQREVGRPGKENVPARMKAWALMTKGKFEKVKAVFKTTADWGAEKNGKQPKQVGVR